MAETWVLIVKSWRKNVNVGLILKCRNVYSIISFEGPALSRVQEKRQFSDIGSHFRGPKGMNWVSQVELVVKNLPANAKDARDAGWEDPLEEDMAAHSNILGLENPMDREAWHAMVHRVAKSQARLKQLSTHERAWVIPAMDTC